MQPKAHLVYVQRECNGRWLACNYRRVHEELCRVRGPERSRRFPSAIDQPLSKLPQGPTDKSLFNTLSSKDSSKDKS